MTTRSMTRDRLPSADWLAFGIGVAAMFGHYLYSPLVGVVALAVFLPSVLRELGLLRDADEWTRQIMHRAGFHTALVAALLVFLGYLMPAAGTEVAQGFNPKDVLGGETLRKAIVWVFLISYLLQYWGGRKGGFRILLGVAVMNTAPVVGFARQDGIERSHFVWAALASAALFAGLAFLVRRFPRAGGWLLLGLGAVACAFIGWQTADPPSVWGGVAVQMQILLIFGVTGLALVREGTETA